MPDDILRNEALLAGPPLREAKPASATTGPSLWAFRWIAAALVAMALLTTGRAQLIYQDDFNYPDGPLLGASGSPWVNNYLPANEVNVTARELFLTQSEQESVRVDFPNSYSNTNLFASFTVRFSALPKGVGNYFAFFRAGGVDALFCRMWTATNNAAAGRFRLGIRAMSSAAVLIPADLSLGVTYNLVVKLATSGGLVTTTLWINPVSESDTTLRAEDQQTGFGYFVGHFGFKQVAFYESPADGMGSLFVDNLRIGFTFESVTPVRFTAVESLGAGGVRFHGVGAAGANYAILASTNLAPASWINLGSAPANASGLIDYTDLTATNHPRRFYRLMAP